MRHETAIAAAFKRADASTSHMQAYSLAAKLLRAAGGKHDAAPLALKKFLDAINADEDLLRGCALGFLQFVARDMKNGDATGPNAPDTLSTSASAPPDGTGHERIDTLSSRARPSPIREPSTSQKQASGNIRRLMAESILTSMRVRDGRAIGKVYRSEASDMIGENWRENAILVLMCKVPLPRDKNDARFDEYITDVQMKRIMARVDRADAA